jgi:tetratricopeptide (TPR) repeat protein
MIPNAEQLRAISQMSRGDLSEIPFPVLLQAYAAHERTLVLSIERRQLKKEIVFENGVPVDCQSNLLQDTLGKFMVSRGDITEPQNLSILSKSATTGQPFTELLVTEGVISASELYKVLQLNLAKKLLDSFTWRSGTFHVGTELPHVDSPLKVKTPQLVLTGVSKFAPEDEVRQAMEPFVDKQFVLDPRATVTLKELRLSKEQQEVVGLVSMGKTIPELETESGMQRPKLLRVLYSLALIGVAVPSEWLSHRAPADSVAAGALDTDFADADRATTTETESDGARGPSLSDEEALALSNDVMETYLRYRKLDPFDLLGAPDDSDRAQLEEHYLAFSEKFAPWKFEGVKLSGIADKARDLFVAGGRAFGELSNPETRNSLIARRQRESRELTSEEARNAFAIKSNLLDSETQFQKGLELVKAEKFAEALELLEFAHDCEPRNSVYRAELAYCRFRKDPALERDRAVEELNETIRIEPDCGLALYYLGVVLGEGGEFEAAEPWLQKAIKLMAPDRRPIDALKRYKADERDRPKKRRFF